MIFHLKQKLEDILLQCVIARFLLLYLNSSTKKNHNASIKVTILSYSIAIQGI
jgi:hypothetical protein